jgi:phage head maturation protease
VTTETDGARWPATITRATALDDLSVRSGHITCDTCGRDATGRVIDAYAGVFGQEAEINDEGGHYFEQIDPVAWNKRLADLSRSRMGLRDVSVFYHHGMTLYGTPSELGTHPVGHPMAIRADTNGLLTSTHYGTTDVAERVFTDLIEGNLTGHSFTGRIVSSDPPRVPRVRRGESLPRVRRLELGLAEYGPTPVPYYTGAQMVGQRAQLLGGHVEPVDQGAADVVDAAVAAGVDIEALAAATRARVRRARLLGVIG